MCIKKDLDGKTIEEMTLWELLVKLYFDWMTFLFVLSMIAAVVTAIVLVVIVF